MLIIVYIYRGYKINNFKYLGLINKKLIKNNE